MEWRKDGAGHHHYCWSQFLAGYIHPVWWHPPDDGRQNGGGGEVVSFNFKMFKLGGRSSQDQSLLLFPNLKFSLYVILRVLSVLEKGSHDLKVLAMLD